MFAYAWLYVCLCASVYVYILYDFWEWNKINEEQVI